MKQKSNNNSDPDRTSTRIRDMRNKAAAEDNPVAIQQLSPEKINELFQELRVHQIELAAQNEELRRVTQELEQSRDQYLELYDFAPVGYFTLTSDYHIAEVNLTACNMLGLNRQNLLNTIFTKNLIPADTDTVYLCLKNAKKSIISIACEFELRKRDGTTFPVSARIQSTENSGREGVCRVAIMDTTEQKKSESALKLSELRFREIVDSLSEGIYEADTKGKMTYINQRAKTLIGVSNEDLEKGFTLFDIFCPEHVEKARNGFARQLRGEDVRSSDYMLRRRDGSSFPVLVHSLAIKHKEVEGVRGIIVDITDQKKVEEALEESEQRFHEMAESLSEGVYETDENGNVTYLNRRAMAMGGVSENDLKIGINIFDFIEPEQMDSLKYSFIRTLAGEDTGSLEVIARKKDGTKFPVLTHNLRIKPDGVQGIRGVIVDITERKKAEADLKKYSQQLEAANSQMQQFIYAVSHDLREPLRMMTSFSQSLKKHLKEPDAKVKEDVSFIVSGAARMQGLLDDLLVYSRVSTQVQSFRKVDMEIVFKDVIDNLKVNIEETGAIITHEKLAEIQADPSQIAQVLQNLIANAIKFHCKGERPVVHVSCKKDSEWMFAVKDNGIGIPQELFGKLFSFFSRLNPQDEYPGTGMGLAITKRIVQRHGGRVWVESEPGKGTTMYFTIALDPAKPEETQLRKTADLKSDSGM